MVQILGVGTEVMCQGEHGRKYWKFEERGKSKE